MAMAKPQKGLDSPEDAGRQTQAAQIVRLALDVVDSYWCPHHEIGTLCTTGIMEMIN